MKYSASVFLTASLMTAAAFSAGCGTVESQPASNRQVTTTTSDSAPIVDASKRRLADLSEEQKRRLNRRIPPEVREILDRAEEFKISYNLDEKTMQLEVLLFEEPNAEAKIANAALKKQFLDGLYSDAASNSNGNACFSPRHRVTAKYKTKVVKLDLCYECGNFRGEGASGNFGGGFASESESSVIIDAIIEKYGTKIK